MTATYDLTTLDRSASAPTVKFPSEASASAAAYCAGYTQELTRALSTIDWEQVDRAAEVLVSAYVRGATAYSCGNGGSASIANHLQCDHMKGVRAGTDLTPRVTSLSSNIEVMTAITNDIGYEEVFRFQLQSQARPGDVLVAISSSGRSPNIVRAIEWANEHELATIALTGFGGGGARERAQVALHIECTNYGVVEDAHQMLMHALAQYVRQSRMTEENIAETTF